MKPYTYKYIDTLNRGTESVTGFKAQEVGLIIPNSTSTENEYIPNIYKPCDILSNSGSAVITISSITTYDLSIGNKLKIFEYFPDSTLESTKQCLNIKSINTTNITLDGFINTSNTPVWIRGIGECVVSVKGDSSTDAVIVTPTDISANLTVGNTFEIYESKPNESEKEHRLEITDISGENVTVNGTFTTTETQVFIYGKEVNDFHTLSYNRIIPVNVAAIQEIDRRVVSHFTGSHTCYKETDSTDFTNNVGLIVVGNGSCKITHNGTTYTGKDAIKIDQATPQIKLSTEDNQKSAIGVVLMIENDTVLINSSGEGGIWVCSKNGDLVNGDYITTCIVPGYGAKQTTDEGTLKNFTVAKITCDVDFSNVSGFENKTVTHNSVTYSACFVSCLYKCG